MAIVNTSIKGQLIIPANLRKKMGIIPGHPVQIIEQKDHLILKPIPKDPVKKSKGILPKTTPSLAKELLEERKREKNKDEHLCAR
ncbi:MAG: AbrB/MazE/SpoVT family DNA-binding domain-containing protein [bacterium]